jgi:hypothetical protein
MKRMLALVLAAVTLVVTLGVTPIAGAAAVSADGASVHGSGTLTAAGDGIAALSGSGNVTITGNGILWVRDFQGSATIEVTGYGKKRVFPDGWLQYSGLDGEAYVSGAKIAVVLAGIDIELFGEGHGRVVLWGHGTYEVNGEPGDWNTGYGARLEL